jgi:hypothetical protein
MRGNDYRDYEPYQPNDYGMQQGQGYQQPYAQEEVNDIEFICDDGQPLQIIRYDKATGKFTVEPEAVNVILLSLGTARSKRQHRFLFSCWKIQDREKFFAQSATLFERSRGTEAFT